MNLDEAVTYLEYYDRSNRPYALGQVAPKGSLGEALLVVARAVKALTPCEHEFVAVGEDAWQCVRCDKVAP